MNDLTKRQLETLRVMRDEEEELIYDHGVGYVGDTFVVGGRTVFALLRAMAISAESDSEPGEGLERYHINDTGRALLKGEPRP